MSIQEARRAGFEAWVKANWPNEGLGQFNNGEYQGFTVNHCWNAWNAALDSVVVELPPVSLQMHVDAQKFRTRQMVEAIEAQGLRVEVKS